MPLRLSPLALSLTSCLLAASVPAQAVPVFELTGRSGSMAMTEIFTAFGTARAELEGNAVSSNTLSPSRLDLTGSGGDSDEDFLFYTEFTAVWALWQDHSTAQVGADTVLSAAGAMAFSGAGTVCNAGLCGPQPVGYTSENFQTLRFSLSESTAYVAAGNSSREQSVNLQYSADGGQSWSTYLGWSSFTTYGGSILNGPQELKPWSQSGVFAAGLYQVSNGPSSYNYALDPSFAWDYSITLLGTQLTAPVPEPSALLLMAGGLGALLLRRRRLAA